MLGFAITAIPGAVFFETLRRSLLDKKSVPKFLIGTFIGMSGVIFLALFGFHFLESDSLARLFYLLSGGILFYLGVNSIISKSSPKKSKSSNYSALLTGVILSFANPISIIFWISLIGKLTQGSSNSLWIILNVISVVAGAFTLFTLLIIFAKHFHSKNRSKYIRSLSIFFGVILTTYGIIIASKAII